MRQYAAVYIEWLIRLFHRFIWSARDLTDLSDKAVFITGQSHCTSFICIAI